MSEVNGRVRCTPGRQTVDIVGIISDLIVLYRLFFGVFADRPREYNQGNKLVEHTSHNIHYNIIIHNDKSFSISIYSYLTIWMIYQPHVN